LTIVSGRSVTDATERDKKPAANALGPLSFPSLSEDDGLVHADDIAFSREKYMPVFGMSRIWVLESLRTDNFGFTEEFKGLEPGVWASGLLREGRQYSGLDLGIED
jgi:hypothetical protein